MSPGDECITHSTIHKSLIFISMTLTGGIFILAWPSILQVGQKKKRERERESHQQHCLFGVFWFCYRLVISAAAAAAGCCHRDTQRHTFRHKTQSHSSCGITETQTGACASTHTNTLQHIPGLMSQRSSHVAVASLSLGQRAVVSDHLFSFPPCLFSKDSVINSLTSD